MYIQWKCKWTKINININTNNNININVNIKIKKTTSKSIPIFNESRKIVREKNYLQSESSVCILRSTALFSSTCCEEGVTLNHKNVLIFVCRHVYKQPAKVVYAVKQWQMYIWPIYQSCDFISVFMKQKTNAIEMF